MQKTIHIKNLLVRALMVAAFGVLFFVQAQAAFITCAYGTDFSPRNSSHISADKGYHLQAANITTPFQKHFKLNKRYQVVSPNAILPAEVQVPAYFIQVRLRWLIPPVLASTHFLYIKPLRGPPFI